MYFARNKEKRTNETKKEKMQSKWMYNSMADYINLLQIYKFITFQIRAYWPYDQTDQDEEVLDPTDPSCLWQLKILLLCLYQIHQALLTADSM